MGKFTKTKSEDEFAVRDGEEKLPAAVEVRGITGEGNPSAKRGGRVTDVEPFFVVVKVVEPGMYVETPWIGLPIPG